MKRVLSFVLFAIVLQACDKSENGPVNPFQYMPLSVGSWSIYDLHEEVYSSGQAAPVIRDWQERDQVTSLVTDGGRTTFLITTSKRNNSEDYWQVVGQYTIDRYPDKALTTMDNRTNVTMVFPVTTGAKWDGNAYNEFEKEEHQYDEIGKTQKIAEKDYANTVTVVERDLETMINFYRGKRVYALGYGLVYEEQIAYEYCQDDDCIGSAKIESGSRRVKILSERSSAG